MTDDKFRAGRSHIREEISVDFLMSLNRLEHDK